MTEPKRVAILGGGMASLTAAFELTSQPGWKDRWDVTIYQQGWRLGGKGASGRNPAHHQRIEEHGLHILLGFYENGFDVLRRCYRELGRRPNQPLATWTDAFHPHDLIVLEEEVDGQWVDWKLDFPRNSASPGDGILLPTPWDYIRTLLTWMTRLFHDWIEAPDDRPDVRVAVRKHDRGVRGTIDHLLRGSEGGLLRELRALVGRTLDAVRDGVGALRDGVDLADDFMLLAIDELALELSRDPARHEPRDHDRILEVLDRFIHGLWSRVEGRLARDHAARRLFIVLDLAATTVRGMIRDGMLRPDIDWFAHDREDFRDWLRRHGAREITVESSAVRALYDIGFSWFDGVGTGTMIHGAARMLLTYNGSIMYEMQAGMGDTVFAPFYEVLRRRGVRFEFFHRVDRLVPSTDGTRVDRIEMGVQMRTKGDRPYEPLFDVKGLPCWPSHPFYDQLERGEELRDSGEDLENFWGRWEDAGSRVLELGQDFDLCVLGISLGGHPFVAGELISRDEKWQAMTEKVRTTQTQAFQLWFGPDLRGLGWTRTKRPPVVGAYVEPLDTWADLSHLLEREDWPASLEPGNLAYLCGVMQDVEPIPGPEAHDYPERQLSRAKEGALDFLRHHPRHLWPNAVQTDDPNRLNWHFLVDPEEREGEARFDAQYVRAPLSPSERYVLSVPGSSRYRLREDGTRYENLFLCGDYILTAVSAGCIEAATMAGKQVSRAISGHPREIMGDWLTQRRPDGTSPPSTPPPESIRRVRAVVTSADRIESADGGDGPIYIERGGDVVLAPPYLQEDCRLYGFLLPDVRYEALTSLCDRYLNAATGTDAYEYRPLGSFVSLVCADIARIRSLDPVDGQKGWIPERDIGFWVPVVRGRRRGGRFEPEAVLWFIPYIWVDDGVPVVTGREVYGFPKEQSQLEMPSQPSAAGVFRVSTTVLPVYGPNEEARRLPLLDLIREDRGDLGDLVSTFENGTDAAAEILEVIRGELFEPGVSLPGVPWALIRTLLENAWQGRVPMVFLKQFRDAHDPRAACYRRVIETDIRIRQVHAGGRIPGEWTLRIQPYESHPVAQELGLPGRPADGIPVGLGFWLSSTFSLELAGK